MRRGLSQTFVVIHWVGMAVSLLSVIAVTPMLVAGQAFLRDGVPAWPVIGLIYLLPVLIGWRIWVHRRAQRRSAVTEVFDTEQDDG